MGGNILHQYKAISTAGVYLNKGCQVQGEKRHIGLSQYQVVPEAAAFVMNVEGDTAICRRKTEDTTIFRGILPTGQLLCL